MSILKYSIGEVLFGQKPHPVDSTCQTQPNKPKPEKCGCGRGLIERVQGASLWTVWTGGSNFGSLEYAACCKLCHDEQYAEFLDEVEDYR